MTAPTWPLVIWPRHPLRTPARPVNAHELQRPDEDTLTRIDHLAVALQATMRLAGGVGIAAPQLAIGVAVAVIAPNPNGPATVLVNPTITDISTDTHYGPEGCLSLPGIGLPVERARHLDITYQDLHGDEHHEHFDGFAARVVSHEIDHLHGLLICDTCPAAARARFLRYWRCQALGLPDDPQLEQLHTQAEAMR
jgi:peptide deformylase